MAKWLVGSWMLVMACAGVGSAHAQTVEYIHTDALGTPVAVTDANRNVIERSEYEPYGMLLNRPLTDGPGYTGHVSDAATGLSYMQQRYYDSSIGRFLSVDPIAANGNNGGNFNRYWYASNNPYKFTDPDGRYVCNAGKQQCGLVRSAIRDLKRSVRSSGSRSLSQRYNIAAVRRFYGEEGDKNGVVVQDDPNLNAAGTALTSNGATTVSVNFSALKAAVPRFKGSSYQDLVSSTVIHEGSHGVDQRRREEKGIDPMTNSRTEFMLGELRAYRVEGLFFRGLGQDSPWLLWTRKGGLNEANINFQANDSVQQTCGPGSNCDP